ncbi:MAG: hypothetical protein M1381_11630 [Deltaproteobacteria bacterium]|nr:hypothetical protein [Deltaproteobacteria bacterium]
MKKTIALIFSVIFTGVSSGYAQKIDTIFEYTQPIAANSKKSFTVNIEGKEYTEIKIVCNVNQQNVVMYYKTDSMNSYDSTTTTEILPYYNYLYHGREFLLSGPLPVKTAGSISLVIENKSDKETSARLTVYGIKQYQ